MGDEYPGRSSSRSENDAEVDSGWDDQPAAAPSEPPRELAAPPLNRASVPPSIPRPDPSVLRSDTPPPSGRPSRPSASYRPGRLSKPLIDTAAHAVESMRADPARLIDLPLSSDTTTLVGSPSAPIVPRPFDLRAPALQVVVDATPPPRPLVELHEASEPRIRVSDVESLSPSHTDRLSVGPSSKRRPLRTGVIAVALLGAAGIAFALRPSPEPAVFALKPAPAAAPSPNVEPPAPVAAEPPAPVAEPPAPVAAEPPAPVAAEPPAPVAAEPPAPVAAESSPRSAQSSITAKRVTIRTSPPGAVIFDERRRIGKDTALVALLPGQKRRLLALLNRHQPTHFVVDGSVETVNIELKPMDADELERASAFDRARAASAPSPQPAPARATGSR